MNKEIKEHINLFDFISMLKEKQSIENIERVSFLIAISSKIIESNIFYDLIGNSKSYKTACFTYLSVGNKTVATYYTITFKFHPYNNQKLHLRCIYEFKDSFYNNFQSKFNHLEKAQLKYVEGIGNMNIKIDKEPFSQSTTEEISIVNFQDWLLFDFNQIIWNFPSKIIGEFSAFKNYSYYFKLPIGDVFSNIDLFDSQTIFNGFENRYYNKRIRQLSTFDARIKKNKIFFNSNYSYYQGDNPRDNFVSFELPLSKIYELIDIYKKFFSPKTS